MPAFTQHDALRWLAFSFIALAVLIFYFPSLYFPPRADQVIYLSETAGLHKPWDLIAGCYNHNRHRTIAPGDELLFRPLLYAFLGTQQVFFGHHFWAWQLVAIAAHLVLIWVLLRLLWRLSNPWLAFAGAWVFALGVFNYEMVTWPHLSSYPLMMACMAASIEQMVLCFEDNQVPWKRMVRLLIYFFIACFIYETANLFALMITGMLFIVLPRWRHRLWILTLPVILYLCWSLFDYVYVDHVVHAAGVLAQVAGVGAYAAAVARLTLWWLYEGLFNGLYHYQLIIRTMFWHSEVMVFKPLVLDNPQVVFALLMFTAFLGLAWGCRRGWGQRTKLAVVLSGMLAAYVLVIVVGRWHETGDLWTSISTNSYFSYIFWAMVVMLAFSFLPVPSMQTGFMKGLLVLFVAASLLSGLCQGIRIHEMALGYSSSTRSIVLLVAALDLLIEEKGKEPGFSFYVDPDFPGNYSYGSIRKPGDPPDKKYSIIEFLYPQYFRLRSLAKYRFLSDKEKPRLKDGALRNRISQ